MYRFFISFFLLFFIVDGFSQQTEETQNDSIVYKTNYGFRLGIDISKPIRAMIQSDYKGLELVGDYRISKKWYIASEIGFEEKITKEDYTNSTAKGSYIRLGVNYNSYKNWLDMNNEIFLGFRYGFATFEQTLNSYQINTGNTVFDSQTITTPVTTNGLTAHWSEIMVGIKAEVFNNIFVGISGSYKVMINVQDPPNFKTHFAPGFNRVYVSNTGFGFNYTISYLIPFSKK
ncbi:DUF6048 family protein [Pseudotenacibaculum sp. MALMAid0570]|uniref:DUF6048 family protein n=1 Tax=Pseudotenacibaculum sp. MALMAid0570 TaxID=3143938 RepID=UPI0032E01A6B